MRTVTIDGLEFKAELVGANPKADRILLACSDREVLRELAESEEPALIGVDGVAESPLKRYPGSVRFPAAPAGREFIAVYAAIEPQKGDPPTPPGRRPVIPYWRAVQAVAEVSIEAPGGEPITEETPVEAVPSPVLNWISLCLEEYDRNFLRAGL